jgi:hypothetical protein
MLQKGMIYRNIYQIHCQAMISAYSRNDTMANLFHSLILCCPQHVQWISIMFCNKDSHTNTVQHPEGGLDSTSQPFQAILPLVKTGL